MKAYTVCMAILIFAIGFDLCAVTVACSGKAEIKYSKTGKNKPEAKIFAVPSVIVPAALVRYFFRFNYQELHSIFQNKKNFP